MIEMSDFDAVVAAYKDSQMEVETLRQQLQSMVAQQAQTAREHIWAMRKLQDDYKHLQASFSSAQQSNAHLLNKLSYSTTHLETPLAQAQEVSEKTIELQQECARLRKELENALVHSRELAHQNKLLTEDRDAKSKLLKMSQDDLKRAAEEKLSLTRQLEELTEMSHSKQFYIDTIQQWKEKMNVLVEQMNSIRQENFYLSVAIREQKQDSQTELNISFEDDADDFLLEARRLISQQASEIDFLRSENERLIQLIENARPLLELPSELKPDDNSANDVEKTLDSDNNSSSSMLEQMVRDLKQKLQHQTNINITLKSMIAKAAAVGIPPPSGETIVVPSDLELSPSLTSEFSPATSSSRQALRNHIHLIDLYNKSLHQIAKLKMEVTQLSRNAKELESLLEEERREKEKIAVVGVDQTRRLKAWHDRQQHRLSSTPQLIRNGAAATSVISLNDSNKTSMALMRLPPSSPALATELENPSSHQSLPSVQHEAPDLVEERDAWKERVRILEAEVFRLNQQLETERQKPIETNERFLPDQSISDQTLTMSPSDGKITTQLPSPELFPESRYFEFPFCSECKDNIMMHL